MHAVAGAKNDDWWCSKLVSDAKFGAIAPV